MTAQRQQNKGTAFRITYYAMIAGLFAVQCVGWPIGEARAGLTERIVIDRYTGLAIGGFDPVAYFTDGAAVPGLGEVEASVQGAVWRFQNEANRSFFLASPATYGPQFGGYDPVGIARGVTAAGRPQIWLITSEQLYLFGSEENRNAFAADPSRFVNAAKARWPGLQATLADG